MNSPAVSGFHDWACFSAQQAAEKTVKAVLQRLGAEAWGHAVFESRNSKSPVRGAAPAVLR
ncbi:MAG: HEPN domain-containing protein [Chloroflexi bacterium]|nr:HEPN domain-containing protein [Chloroflexota bacterium]